jgi:hypothetical protein
MYQLHWTTHPIFHMARRRSNLLAVLLLTMVTTASAATPDTSMMITARARPAACHQHGPTAPASQPVSYRCCQSGHDSAILQTAFTWQLSFAGVTCASESAHAVPLGFVHDAYHLLVSSPSPPFITPLRV